MSAKEIYANVCIYDTPEIYACLCKYMKCSSFIKVTECFDVECDELSDIFMWNLGYNIF